MSDVATSKTRRVESLIPIFNPLMKRLIGAGFPAGPNVLLTVRGRKTGLPRTFPIAILELDGRRFVQSPYGEVDWVRNLRAAGQAVVTKGHHREEVEATELTPEIGGPILREAVAPYLRSRLTAAFAGLFVDIRADSTAADAVDAVRRNPMFELRQPK